MDISKILGLLGGKNSSNQNQQCQSIENPCTKNSPKEAGFVGENAQPPSQPVQSGINLQSILPLLLAMKGGGLTDILSSKKDNIQKETDPEKSKSEDSKKTNTSNDLLLSLLNNIKH